MLLYIISVIVFRRKYPNMERPYKVLAYPVTVVITSLVFLGLILNNLAKDQVNSILSCVVQIFAVALYMYFDKKIKKEKVLEDI